MSFFSLLRLTTALFLAGAPLSATTLSEGAFDGLGTGAILDPGTLPLVPSARARAAIAAARANFDTAVGLLEEELRTHAGYGSILAVAEELKVRAPSDARVFRLHAIALAATGDLPGVLPLLARAMIAHRGGRHDEAEAALLGAVAEAPGHPLCAQPSRDRPLGPG